MILLLSFLTFVVPAQADDEKVNHQDFEEDPERKSNHKGGEWPSINLNVHMIKVFAVIIFVLVIFTTIFVTIVMAMSRYATILLKKMCVIGRASYHA